MLCGPARVVRRGGRAREGGGRARPASLRARSDTDDAALEIHLAIACARGDAAALGHFERRFLDAVGPALAPMRLPAATLDDVRQEVRRKLLVGEDGAPPRILAYAGDGSLRGLVGVVAVRTALSMLRKERREAPDDDLLDLPDADPDPRLQLMKARYQAAPCAPRWGSATTSSTA